MYVWLTRGDSSIIEKKLVFVARQGTQVALMDIRQMAILIVEWTHQIDGSDDYLSAS